MAFEDTGIRVTVLGVAAFRRSTAALRNDMTALNSSFSSASGATSNFSNKLSNVSASMVSFGRAMTTFVTVPITVAAAQVISAGASFESAFAGVTKTVDGTTVSFYEAAAQMGLFGRHFTDAQKEAIFASDAFGQLTEEGSALRDGIRALALEVPISVNELARIGQLGGQLGVPRDQLLGFIETIALLGVSTDLTTDAAAESFAKLGNIMGVEANDLSNWTFEMGNALVQLGNNFAAREPQILSMTMRLAAAGSQAGFTTEDLLGIATALSAMGIPAELGGTAVSRMFTQMNDAAANFKLGTVNDQLAEMSRLTGLTNSEMVNFINTDPNGAFLAIVNALSQLNEEGTFTSSILTDMEVGGVRALAVFQALSGNTDLLTDAQKQANSAAKEGVALQSEAAIFFNTFNNAVTLLKNAFIDLGIEIFDLYSNDLKNLVAKISEAITSFKDMNPTTLKAITNFLLIAAAVGPIITSFGLLGQAIAGIWGGLLFLMKPLSLVASLFGGLISTPVIFGLLAVGGLIIAIKENLWGLGETFATVLGVASIIVGTIKYRMEQFGFSVDDLAKAFANLDFNAVIDELKQAVEGILFYFKNDAKMQFEAFWPAIRADLESNVNQMTAWLAEQLPKLAAWGIVAVFRLTSWAASVWTELSPKLASFATELINWLATKAVEIGQKFVEEWIPAFVNWAVDIWGKINDPLFGMMMELGAWLIAMAGYIGNKLVNEWIPSFIEWIAPMIGEAILQLDEFILVDLIPWIANQATTIADNFLGEWLPAFIEWFGPMIEEFMGNLGTWLGSLTGWLLFTALPRIVIAVGTLAIAMVEWVSVAIPQLLVALGKYMWAMIRFIVFDLAPGVGAFIFNFGKAFVEQMFNGIKNVFGVNGESLNAFRDKMQDKITEFTTSIGNSMYEMGKNLINRLIEGIRDFAGSIGLDTGLKALSDVMGLVGMDSGAVKDLLSWIEGPKEAIQITTQVDKQTMDAFDAASQQYYAAWKHNQTSAPAVANNPQLSDTFGSMGIMPVPTVLPMSQAPVTNNNMSTFSPTIYNPSAQTSESDLMTLHRRMR